MREKYSTTSLYSGVNPGVGFTGIWPQTRHFLSEPGAEWAGRWSWLCRSCQACLAAELFSTVGFANTVFVTLFPTTVEGASCEVHKFQFALAAWLPTNFNICCSGGGVARFSGSEFLGRAIHRFPTVYNHWKHA